MKFLAHRQGRGSVMILVLFLIVVLAGAALTATMLVRPAARNLDARLDFARAQAQAESRVEAILAGLNNGSSLGDALAADKTPHTQAAIEFEDGETAALRITTQSAASMQQTAKVELFVTIECSAKSERWVLTHYAVADRRYEKAP